MAIKIGHASIDERGKAYGGKAGDSTGKELRTRNWYKGGWHTVLRPKDFMVAEKSAAACEAACNNEKIGYDQHQRNTLHKQAKAVNFDLSKIATACECDCSSLMHVCAIAGGAAIEYGTNGLTTRNMVAAFIKSGAYEKLTDSKYLTSDKYIRRGDILVKSGHTVMALEDGAAARIVTFTMELPVISEGSSGKEVEALQRLLASHGYNLGNKNPFDGKFGDLTDAALRRCQKDNDLIVDGEAGAQVWGFLLHGTK